MDNTAYLMTARIFRLMSEDALKNIDDILAGKKVIPVSERDYTTEVKKEFDEKKRSA